MLGGAVVIALLSVTMLRGLLCSKGGAGSNNATPRRT